MSEIATIVIYQGPPGPAGSSAPPFVDVGSRASPTLITSSIAAPTNQQERKFIKGSGGPVVDPSIGNGSGTRELLLFCCSDTDTVELNDTANLQLSGKWIGADGSMLFLQWDGGSKWVEVGRNEI